MVAFGDAFLYFAFGFVFLVASESVEEVLPFLSFGDGVVVDYVVVFVEVSLCVFEA